MRLSFMRDFRFEYSIVFVISLKRFYKQTIKMEKCNFIDSFDNTSPPLFSAPFRCDGPE